MSGLYFIASLVLLPTMVLDHLALLSASSTLLITREMYEHRGGEPDRVDDMQTL